MKKVTLNFLKQQYRYAVWQLCDDPDEVTNSPSDFVKYYKELRTIGKDIGLDFWEVATEEMQMYYNPAKRIQEAKDAFREILRKKREQHNFD